MIPSISQLAFYSLGIVAANKKLSSKEIEVTPIEDKPTLDGEITDNTEQYEGSSVDADGREHTDQLESTASIRALWLPYLETHRRTAPDVRRGEKVAIYRFADVDEYFWTTLTHHYNLRRLETIIWQISNLREENTEMDPNNTYWFEVSTHRKCIHMQTSKNDGEPFMYTWQLNTKDGCWTFMDDDDNYMFMNSQERRIKFHNKDTSYIDMNKKEIFIHSLDLIQMDSKKIIINGQELIEQNTKDHKTSASSSYSISTQDYKVQSQSYTIDASIINFSNNVNAPLFTGTFSGPHI